MFQGSWKTTVLGLLAAAFQAASAVQDPNADWKSYATAIAIALFGLVARDNNKTSEQAGARR